MPYAASLFCVPGMAYKKDIVPVKNAISFSLSSGFAEEGNCRYKSVKRLMFGRAGQDHLFHKTYAISIIMRQSLNPKEVVTDWLGNTARKIWPKRKKEMPHWTSLKPSESGFQQSLRKNRFSHGMNAFFLDIC